MITFICEKNYIAFETPIFLLFNAFKIISRENPGYNILASHKRRIRMTPQKLRPRVKAGGHYKDPSLPVNCLKALRAKHSPNHRKQ